ncbi:MAG: 2-C-methyl-D-erythritol 4-phosphate cytidylyltransferase [Desulfobulbus sp.]|nr:2-C-methyl-D-erythritol 4-phosphate cytidylyltransferase [Desulfobulbus sp.]
MTPYSRFRVGVIIPAGGTGSRFGHTQPKQFLELAGKPVLIRTCQAFLDLETVQTVVIAVPAGYRAYTAELIRTRIDPENRLRVLMTDGGLTRQESVQAGLKVLPDEIDMVLVHDAARPLVDRETILRCLDGAARFGATIAAIQVSDTLKHVRDDGSIASTVDRRHIWQAQTPQAARRTLLEQAFATAALTNFSGTDEASLLEAAGIPVRVVKGSEHNRKITLPEDLQMAEALLMQRRRS